MRSNRSDVNEATLVAVLIGGGGKKQVRKGGGYRLELVIDLKLAFLLIFNIHVLSSDSQYAW